MGGATVRLKGLVTSRAAGSMVSQLWQAAASFVLSILAAHQLGAEGLGIFALCFGVIVMATAVVSGVVGDSLTVLDRHEERIRGGLQWWAVLLIGTSSIVAAVVLAYSHVLSVTEAVVFFGACAVFQVEELLRRLLMAQLRFWSLIVVDTTALAGSLATMAASLLLGRPSLLGFLLAITIGQVLGCAAALLLIPQRERYLAGGRRPALAAVAHFGLWRGAQVAVNPSVLTGVRSLVVVAAGGMVLGELEAARIFVAPAILVVQGLGSYLLASYVRDKSGPLAVLTARASSASLRLALAVLAMGAVAALLVPFAGPLVTGSTFAVSPAAVFGWSVYAAASATLAPYASLAAARGRQRAVFLIRLVDSGVGLGLVAVCLIVLALPALVTPFALAVGLVVGGVLVRVVVLRPMVAAERRSLPGPDNPTREGRRPLLLAAVPNADRPHHPFDDVIATTGGQDIKDTA